MWPNPQFPADLVTFTEEILNGKLHFLCSEIYDVFWTSLQLNQGITQEGHIIKDWFFVKGLESKLFDPVHGTITISNNGYYSFTATLGFIDHYEITTNIIVSIIINGKGYRNFTVDMR